MNNNRNLLQKLDHYKLYMPQLLPIFSLLKRCSEFDCQIVQLLIITHQNGSKLCMLMWSIALSSLSL